MRRGCFLHRSFASVFLSSGSLPVLREARHAAQNSGEINDVHSRIVTEHTRIARGSCVLDSV